MHDGLTLTNHFSVGFNPDLVSRMRGDDIQSGRSQGQHTVDQGEGQTLKTYLDSKYSRTNLAAYDLIGLEIQQFRKHNVRCDVYSKFTALCELVKPSMSAFAIYSNFKLEKIDIS